MAFLPADGAGDGLHRRHAISARRSRSRRTSCCRSARCRSPPPTCPGAAPGIRRHRRLLLLGLLLRRSSTSSTCSYDDDEHVDGGRGPVMIFGSSAASGRTAGAFASLAPHAAVVRRHLRPTQLGRHRLPGLARVGWAESWAGSSSPSRGPSTPTSCGRWNRQVPDNSYELFFLTLLVTCCLLQRSPTATMKGPSTSTACSIEASTTSTRPQGKAPVSLRTSSARCSESRRSNARATR